MRSVTTRIVKTGNSRGIRIPKILLDQADLGEEVELELQDSSIVIRSHYPVRFGWDEQLKEMANQGDDHFVEDLFQFSTWDEEEWEW